MKNKLLTIAVASLVALTACNKAPAPAPDSGSTPNKIAAGKKLTVGFAQEGAESDWRVAESK